MQTTGQSEAKKKQLVQIEWELFDQVKNDGGRASCQDDPDTFSIMRMSQFDPWPEELLDSYLNDLRLSMEQGRNLLSEKYAWMMKDSAPEQFEQLRSMLPPEDPLQERLLEETIAVQVRWMEEYCRRYWALSFGSRVIHTSEDRPGTTSFETYLRGELHTYSMRTLKLYHDFVFRLDGEQKNLTLLVMRKTVSFYGYDSLEAADSAKKDEALQTLLEDLDRLFDTRDYDRVLSFLDHWIGVFRASNDSSCELTLQNEKIGFCRKSAQKEECHAAIERAELLVARLRQEDRTAGATTWLNIATALKDFQEYDRAETYFSRAEEVLVSTIPSDDYRLAALYNNQALLYTALDRYEDALDLYRRAMEILDQKTDSDPLKASTHISLAHLYQKRTQNSRDPHVQEHIQEALRLLCAPEHTPSSYHAYVCETSARSLKELGYEEERSRLLQLARQYYDSAERMRKA